MAERPKILRKEEMTAAQLECFQLLCKVFYGEHHVPDQVYGFGRGIKCSVYSGSLSTFDFDYLTRLVVLAHDACIRVEIISSGPGRVGIALHKRAGRVGSTFDRHPTIEESIPRVRGEGADRG